MYCGATYETVWHALTERERWCFSYGQGMYWRPMARIVRALTGHELLFHEFTSKDSVEPLPTRALLTVVSRTLCAAAGREVHHLVYWDGERCRDPQPAGETFSEWPDGELRGIELNLRYHDDYDESTLDWAAYYEDSAEMALDGALGRKYAEGLLPWQTHKL